MKVGAVVLAAGSSQRFGSDKLNALLGSKPVWRWSYDALARHPEIDQVGIVAQRSQLGEFRRHAPDAAFLVAGGNTRKESARVGVTQLADDVDIILIQDAARPFLSQKLISDVIAGVQECRAACPAMPVTDTIKMRDGDRLQTLDRQKLIAVQTPQGATRSLLLEAYALENESTDDMALIESLGITPKIVEGDPNNIKITHPDDYASAIARVFNAEVRTGLGYDIHPFSGAADRPLMLGGIHFEGHRGLEGHSDADVLLHAIVDALFGSAGLGDIGVHFPNTDPNWKGAPSEHFLKEAGEMLGQEGWEIINIDATVIAETPKVMVRREMICRKIAAVLRMEPQRVSVKATTNEQLGAIGRGEGISAFAVATVRKLG